MLKGKASSIRVAPRQVIGTFPTLTIGRNSGISQMWVKSCVNIYCKIEINCAAVTAGVQGAKLWAHNFIWGIICSKF